MAVYTLLSQEEIQDFLSSYTLAPLKAASGIASGVENTNYLLAFEDGKRLILTLFEKRVEASGLPFFTGLMEALAGYIPCPRPVKDRLSRTIQTLKGKAAIMVSFLEGKSTASLQPCHLGELGEFMAKLHKGAMDYPLKRANTLSLPGWEDIYAQIHRRADEITPGLASFLKQELAFLREKWSISLPGGIIHGDLFPDNVFFDTQDKLSGIIDFYFACNETLAYDIAICLNAWCFEKDLQFNITKARALLTRYHAVRPLEEAELDSLPLLARGAALRFLLTRSHDWLFPVKDAIVTLKDPMEYVSKLRFHQGIKHHREYGL